MTFPIPENIPDQSAIELSTQINAAIENLPEKSRNIFILSRFQGLKYHEIAEVCQISIKTVENRMSQALKLLRDELL